MVYVLILYPVYLTYVTASTDVNESQRETVVSIKALHSSSIVLGILS